MPIRELLSTPGLFTEPLALVSSDGTIETSNQQFAEELGLSAKTLAARGSMRWRPPPPPRFRNTCVPA